MNRFLYLKNPLQSNQIYSEKLSSAHTIGSGNSVEIQYTTDVCGKSFNGYEKKKY